MSMWLSTNKVFDNSLMFFKFQKTNDSCLFNFTNGKKMFSKEVSIASFDELYSSIESNQVEVEVMEVINFLENIDETNNISFNFFSKNSDQIKTEMIIVLTDEYIFKLEFNLVLKDENYFYNHFTKHLLETIKVLKKNQDDLFKIINKKDAEIAEYKLEGGDISHKNLITETFDQNKFLMETFQKHKGLSDESYAMHTSALIEKLCNECSDEFKQLENKPDSIDQHVSKTNSKKETHIDCSTAMEISHTSVNVKKRKRNPLLNNL